MEVLIIGVICLCVAAYTSWGMKRDELAKTGETSNRIQKDVFLEEDYSPISVKGVQSKLNKKQLSNKCYHLVSTEICENCTNSKCKDRRDEEKLRNVFLYAALVLFNAKALAQFIFTAVAISISVGTKFLGDMVMFIIGAAVLIPLTYVAICLILDIKLLKEWSKEATTASTIFATGTVCHLLLLVFI